MKKTFFLIIMASFFLFQSLCLANSDSVTIGNNITISLGEQRQTVINKLWNHYDLIPDNSAEGSYQIIPKKGQQIDAAISITFKDGAVYTITKTTPSFTDTKMADKLLEIIENVLKDKNNTATVEVIRGIDLLGSSDAIVFDFSTKRITINITKATDSETVTISETLQKRPPIAN